MPEAITQIAQQSGFSFTFHAASSYNDGIYQTATNPLIDIVWSAYFVTEARARVIEWSTPMASTGMVVVALREESVPWWKRVMAIGEPISTPMWGLLVLMILYASLIFWLLDAGNFLDPELEEKSGGVTRGSALGEHKIPVTGLSWQGLQDNAMTAVWTSFSSLSGNTPRPLSDSAKVFSCCWQIFCLVFVASYTANLAAYLTRNEVQNKGIGGIADLARSKDPTCVLEGTSFWELLQLDYPHLVPYFVTGSLESIIDNHLRPGHCRGIVYDYDFAMHVTNKKGYCDAFIAGSANNNGIFKKLNYGVAVKRNHAGLAQHLTVQILRAQDANLFERMFTKWVTPALGACNMGSSLEYDPDRQVTLDHLSFLGPILLVVVTGALLLPTRQCYYYYYRTQRREEKERRRRQLQGEAPHPERPQPAAVVALSRSVGETGHASDSLHELPYRNSHESFGEPAAWDHNRVSTDEAREEDGGRPVPRATIAGSCIGIATTPRREPSTASSPFRLC